MPEFMKTEILKIDSSNQDDHIRRVSQLLEQGALIAIPTETVYGLAARACKDMMARLDAVKERPSEKRYTLHIGDKADLVRYVPKPTAPARKLIAKGWPGPITIVFELDQTALRQQQQKIDKEMYDVLYAGDTIGIRCPDQPVCSRILKAVLVPIVVPSANPVSLPPATSAQKVLEYFDGKIEMIIDGGDDACRYKKSSTVVKIGANGIKVLREGVHSPEEIFEMATVRILFVCTGNSCRSPMAEAICKKILADKFGCSIDELQHFGYTVESAGIAAIEGLSASKEAEIVCREYGTSIAGHQSRQLTPQQICKCDKIFVMSAAHFHACMEMTGGSGCQIQMLDEENEVPDPIGRGLETYRKCAEQIQAALKERIDEFL